MDFQQFNDLYNQNDEFVPTFDLGMDELMSQFNSDEETETEAPREEQIVPDIPPPNQERPTIITDDNIHDFAINQKAKSTVYKETSATKRLQIFLKERNPLETRMFYELAKPELDHLLCEFFILAKKAEKSGQTDDEYEPDTLTLPPTGIHGRG